jgi:hypothetical protein
MKLGKLPEGCDVDREASNTAHIQPIWPIMKIGERFESDTWPIFDLRGSTSIKASLIRFYHPNVIATLQFVGLMPRPAAPTGATATVEAQDTVTAAGTATRPEIAGTVTTIEVADSAASSGTVSEPPTPTTEEVTAPAASASPSFPTLEMLGIKGWQQEPIWKAASELYNKGMPENLRAAHLCREIEKWRNTKARERGDKVPQKHPSEDSCGRFLKAYHAWHAKQPTLDN